LECTATYCDAVDTGIAPGILDRQLRSVEALDECLCLWQRVPMLHNTSQIQLTDQFDQILLWAQDMSALAEGTVLHLQRLGARNVKLIWHTSLSDPDAWNNFPQSAPSDIEKKLVLIARQQDMPARESFDGHACLAWKLTGQQYLWAIVYFELPLNDLRIEYSQPWQDALSKLALRCQSALKTERLTVDVDQLARAERLQRSLFAISDLANSSLETHEVLHDIHMVIGGLMYAENFYIVRFDPQHESIRFIYFSDTHDANPPSPYAVFSAAEMPNSVTIGMLRLGKPMHGSSSQLREQLGLSHYDGLGPDSRDWLGVPMIDPTGQVIGGVAVQTYEDEHHYSADDQALLAYVGQHILTVLLHRDAQAELEKRVLERTSELQSEVLTRQRSERLQKALFKIAEISQTASSLQTFYASIHQIIGELLYAQNFYIALLANEGKTLQFPYFIDEHDTERTSRPIGNGLSEYVIRHAQTVLLSRKEIDALKAAGEVQPGGTKSQSWMGAPLISDGKAFGLIVLQSYNLEHFYLDVDKELLSFVAVHVTNAYEKRIADENLKLAYAELEKRVADRTHELANANNELRDQISVRERVELKLKHETLHDSLTKLPNRNHLLGRLGRALGHYHSNPERIFAVLFLDLDRFKVVNDSVGHLAGDEMLIEAAKRISSCIREPDLVARLGGDEFAVVLEGIASIAEVTPVADRIIRVFNTPMRISGKELLTSASVGITIASARYHNPEELLRDADVAMYRAKANGRKRYEIFDEGLHAVALKTLDMELDLRRGIASNEFVPYYQAIWRLSDKKILGFEALMRWQHPERGVLAPSEFMSLATETGNLETMDWQLYEHVCRTSSLLVGEYGEGYINLNVSPAHLRNPAFVDKFIALIQRYQVEPDTLRLEFTEGALLEDPQQVALNLAALKKQGIATVLDDFGTGYSSLSYLHRFPLTGLKIDRSFVVELNHHSSGGTADIVRAIRLMADSLGLDVIAEGIETEAQRDQLRDLGIGVGQGYLFSKAVSLEAAKALLQQAPETLHSD
jgi:diguanylate cyclase (GGDEF)-like protein